MHKVLVNHLIKLAQEKVWLGLVDRDVKPQTKQKKCFFDKKVLSTEKDVVIV